MRLTPELVQQIFAERPHVKRAHAALVPQSTDEKAFWSQFMKHEMARRVGPLRWHWLCLCFPACTGPGVHGFAAGVLVANAHEAWPGTLSSSHQRVAELTPRVPQPDRAGQAPRCARHRQDSYPCA